MGRSSDDGSRWTQRSAAKESRLAVLIVVPWDQELGGVASVVGNLATGLEANGHAVWFFHPIGGARLEPRTTRWGFRGVGMALRSPSSPERPVRSALAFWLTLPAVLLRLARFLRSRRIDIINIHYPIESFAVFSFCRALLPIKLVVSIHGADLFPDGARPARYPRSQRTLLARADLVVAPSTAFRDEFIGAFPDVARRAVAIHNGIDLVEFEPDTIAAAPEGNLLLCIADFNRKKGVDVLLRAFSALAARRLDLRLVLIGDGPLRGRLEALARELGVDPRVDFLGWRGRSEVAARLHACRVLVLPSRAEPFGIAAVEAMACGRPVVASAVGGLREIVRDGENGVLVPPDDPEALAAAVSELLADPARAARLGEAGRRDARERFDRRRMGACYIELFHSLVSGS